MTGDLSPSVFAGQPALLGELYERSGAARFGLTEAEFAAALNQIARQYLRPGGSNEARKLFESLHLEELALARACAAGHEAAWTEFLNRYREPLYQAAYAICRNDVQGRELADSLYADLYGIRTREPGGAAGPERASKLASYTGRGSLAGWLRSVLAQEYVNRYRQQRRLVSLEEQTELGTQFAAASQEPAPAADPRLSQASGKAIAGLDAEGRFLLAEYFLDGRSLAEIARTLGVHESTISRKLQRVAKDLRQQIKRDLVRSGMSGRAAEEALQADVRDLEINVRQLLKNAHNNPQNPAPAENLQESAARSFHAGEGKK